MTKPSEKNYLSRGPGRCLLRAACGRRRAYCVLMLMLQFASACSSPAASTGAGKEGNQDNKDAGQNAALKKRLTPQQYACTQENDTERPFANAYYKNHADGVYLDVVSGEPLFSSLDKFDSGSGWPSFTKPLADNIVEREDKRLGMVRTEVRSRGADSHLGHRFDDGPTPSGQRFCINSASLRFVPLENLTKEGLAHYMFDFAAKKGWQVATFAGGCFWGMQDILRQQPGVLTTEVGYTGGVTAHPTYRQVCTGSTGHAESVRVLFDPAKTNYRTLVTLFFRMHDPTTPNAQHNDHGSQYRSAIFVHDEAQRKVAQEVMSKVDASKAWGRKAVTIIAAAGPFWAAESEHQNYLQKHPGGYTCHRLHDFTFE